MKIIKKVKKIKNAKGYKIHYDKPCALIEIKGDKKMVEWFSGLLELKIKEYSDDEYEFV